MTTISDDRLHDVDGPPVPQEHPLVLVCAADERYAGPMAITMFSALANYRGTTPVRVFAIDNGITAPTRARVERVLATVGSVPRWLVPDPRTIRHLRTSHRYPLSIYARLLIPTLLPQWARKAIYLDSDLVVNSDLAALWASDVGAWSLLAVADEGVRTLGSEHGVANCRELGLDPAAPYFNSGVLVLNLERWRADDIAARVFAHVEAYPDLLRYGEQDALNAVLAGEWGALDARWNQNVWMWDPDDASRHGHGILHFLSACKPWAPDGAHWTNHIFDRYLRRSGWYSGIAWWRYYVPLLLRRQHVFALRRRAAGASVRAARCTAPPTGVRHPSDRAS